jgi:hypothetical protein
MIHWALFETEIEEKENIIVFHEIWGSHPIEDTHVGLLGWNAACASPYDVTTQKTAIFMYVVLRTWSSVFHINHSWL